MGEAPRTDHCDRPMNSQRFIISYLPPILNIVVGLTLILLIPRILERRGAPMTPARVRAVKRVRIIGIIMAGLAVLILFSESIFGAG